jgi:hypothetical protein
VGDHSGFEKVPEIGMKERSSKFEKKLQVLFLKSFSVAFWLLVAASLTTAAASAGLHSFLLVVLGHQHHHQHRIENLKHTACNASAFR